MNKILYKQKHHKYKNKYLLLKNKMQWGGVFDEKQYMEMLNKWEQKIEIYPFIQQLIQNPPNKLEFPYIVDPDSVRGQDLIEILNKMAQCAEIGGNDIKDLKYLYSFWHDIDENRLNLMILTLQMMLFCEKWGDMGTHLNLGRGDEYPSDNVRRIFDKYPYTKALCIFDRDCPYWECKKSITEFKLPYQILINGRTRQIISHEDIILTNKIITCEKVKDATEKAISHHHMWGHLIPEPHYFDGSGEEELLDYFDWSNVPEGEAVVYSKEAKNAPLKRNCKNQEDRTTWGKRMDDRWWRSNYAYITELCIDKKGMYYWD